MPTAAQPDNRLTYKDFLRFPDDGKRHEIINGVHYVTPSPVLTHQQLLGRLYYALADYLRRHEHVGEAFLSPLDVVLSNWDVVEPDLLVVLAGQRNILTKKNVQGPPAIVVEILSPSTRRRDRGIKRNLFERAGVLEYWLIDPGDRSVTVLVRGDERFGPPRLLSAELPDALTTDLLPGFSLPLTDYFRQDA